MATPEAPHPSPSHRRSLASEAERQQFRITVPQAWVRAYPQSAHLLREEAVAWRKMPWSFAVTVA